MSDIEKNLADFINVEVRFDDHPPLGPHINVESVIDLQGSREGRQLRLTNNHSPFNTNE